MKGNADKSNNDKVVTFIDYTTFFSRQLLRDNCFVLRHSWRYEGATRVKDEIRKQMHVVTNTMVTNTNTKKSSQRLNTSGGE